MKKIQLTQGKVALVDDEVYEEISCYKWHAVKIGSIWYAIRRPRINGKKVTILMHRQILGFPEGEIVDHADMNGLNNQSNNLRICTKGENLANSRPSIRNSSGYRGVDFSKRAGLWRARICQDGKVKHIGYFATREEAGLAYDIAAKELFGEFARPNLTMSHR